MRLAMCQQHEFGPASQEAFGMSGGDLYARAFHQGCPLGVEEGDVVLIGRSNTGRRGAAAAANSAALELIS